MTQTLAIDQTNDLILDAGGNLVVLRDLAAVECTARSTAQVRRGDMVLIRDQGIPFEQTAWAGVPNIPLYVAQLRRRLLAVDGVTGIVELTTARDGDTLRYSATLRTRFGDVSVNG